jgi:hypothetical protein
MIEKSKGLQQNRFQDPSDGLLNSPPEGTLTRGEAQHRDALLT